MRRPSFRGGVNDLLTASTQSRSRSSLPIARADDLNAFRGIVSSSFVPLRVTSDHPDGFAARVFSTEADAVSFTEIKAKPHLVERTPESIASGGSGYYKVSLLLSGTSILVQDGKELVLRAGDLSVYDTSRPYSLLFGEDFRNLVIMFSKDRLNLPNPVVEQLTAVPLNQEHPALTPIISQFLAQFPSQLVDLPDRVRAKLARTSLDLMDTLFSSILDAHPEQRDPRQVLLQRISSYIDQNLASSDLTPGSIAEAHYISTRHLHSLFHEANTTVSTWIRERRLERCRTDLLDPVLSDRTVAAIAARWGFTDAAHFSRIFKSAYEVSPSEIRRS